MRGRVCPPRQSRPQASSMEGGEACEPPKGAASEAATGRSQSARSVHCWETIWFHARTESKKQLVLGVQYRAKRLRVSDFPSRYHLVLPRSSSTPAPFSTPLPLRLSLPTTSRAGSASARSHGAASACFPPSGWAVGGGGMGGQVPPSWPAPVTRAPAGNKDPRL